MGCVASTHSHTFSDFAPVSGVNDQIDGENELHNYPLSLQTTFAVTARVADSRYSNSRQLHGSLEITESELIFHRPGHTDVKWPLHFLRRYGFEPGLFSFESGRRCESGEGVFTFQCAQAEDLFMLLQTRIQSVAHVGSSDRFPPPIILQHNRPPLITAEQINGAYNASTNEDYYEQPNSQMRETMVRKNENDQKKLDNDQAEIAMVNIGSTTNSPRTSQNRPPSLVLQNGLHPTSSGCNFTPPPVSAGSVGADNVFPPVTPPALGSGFHSAPEAPGGSPSNSIECNYVNVEPDKTSPTRRRPGVSGVCPDTPRAGAAAISPGTHSALNHGTQRTYSSTDSTTRKYGPIETHVRLPIATHARSVSDVSESRGCYVNADASRASGSRQDVGGEMCYVPVDFSYTPSPSPSPLLPSGSRYPHRTQSTSCTFPNANGGLQTGSLSLQRPPKTADLLSSPRKMFLMDSCPYAVIDPAKTKAISAISARNRHESTVN